MKRDSFIIYRSFYALIKLLPQKKRVVLYEAILDFGFDECEPTFEDDTQNAIWAGILPQLVANNKRYLNSLKGGAPVGNDNAQKTTEKQPKNNQEPTEKTTKKQPNENENENVNENANDNGRNSTPNVFINKNILPPVEKSHIFKPPTLEEVQAYCEERKNKVNAQQFIDFYQSNGWMVGKNKMKDWRAAVRTWEARDKKEHGQSEEKIPYAN